MSKVFVPQQPSRFDRQSRLWVPTVNLSKAESFGELKIILPPNINRMHTSPLVDALKRGMVDFCAGDYLVAVGDPTLIAAAAIIARKQTGGTVSMLKWDRMAGEYIAVDIFVD